MTEPPQERYMCDSARVENCGPSVVCAIRGRFMWEVGGRGFTHANNGSLVMELDTITSKSMSAFSDNL